MERRPPNGYSVDREPERSRNEPVRQAIEPETRLQAIAKPPLDPMQERAMLRNCNLPRPLTGAARGVPRSTADDLAPATDRPRELAADFRSRSTERLPVARRPMRARHAALEIGLNLRLEERSLIQEIGKFRVVAVPDAIELLYGGNEVLLRKDLDYLKQHGLIESHLLNARRDNLRHETNRFEGLTLTRRGRDLVNNSSDLPADQRIYAGLVKPREAEHDAQIFRAYRKELAEIERAGGSNPRVRLDFELKAQMNRSLYVARQADPDRDVQEIKAEVARQLDLTIAAGKFVVPDLRIEYDLPGGGSSHVDVEVATAAYRHSQVAAKARAGMRIYAANIGRLGGAIQDDHDIMSEIMSL